jgi:hypothetical protein
MLLFAVLAALREPVHVVAWKSSSAHIADVVETNFHHQLEHAARLAVRAARRLQLRVRMVPRLRLRVHVLSCRYRRLSQLCGTSDEEAFVLDLLAVLLDTIS